MICMSYLLNELFSWCIMFIESLCMMYWNISMHLTHCGTLTTMSTLLRFRLGRAMVAIIIQLMLSCNELQELMSYHGWIQDEYTSLFFVESTCSTIVLTINVTLWTCDLKWGMWLPISLGEWYIPRIVISEKCPKTVTSSIPLNEWYRDSSDSPD